MERHCRSGGWTAIAGQIVNQLIGTAIAWVLAIVGTLVILKIVDGLVGLRVEKDQEIEGSGSQPARRGRIYSWRRKWEP